MLEQEAGWRLLQEGALRGLDADEGEEEEERR